MASKPNTVTSKLKMGVGASVPPSDIGTSVYVGMEIFQNLYDFSLWLVDHGSYSFDICDGNLGPLNVKLSLDYNLTYNGYASSLPQWQLRGYGRHYKQKLPRQSFKHHFIVLQADYCYLLVEYFNSSKVHITACQYEAHLRNQRANITLEANFAIGNHNIDDLFRACGAFTNQDFSLLSHNCKDFAKHIISWLSY